MGASNVFFLVVVLMMMMMVVVIIMMMMVVVIMMMMMECGRCGREVLLARRCCLLRMGMWETQLVIRKQVLQLSA